MSIAVPAWSREVTVAFNFINERAVDMTQYSAAKLMVMVMSDRVISCDFPADSKGSGSVYLFNIMPLDRGKPQKDSHTGLSTLAFIL
jgi:hypothetical protein